MNNHNPKCRYCGKTCEDRSGVCDKCDHTHESPKTKAPKATQSTPLRPGSQTGSFINYIHSGSKNPAPKVGMGATVLMYSDRHAATVVRLISPRAIEIQEDTATRTDSTGASDVQSYDYKPNPTGTKEVYTLRKNGAWVLKGESLKGRRLKLGVRDHYYDFTR